MKRLAASLGLFLLPGLLADKESEQLLYPFEVEFAWPEGRNWRVGQAAEIVLP